MYSWDPVFVDVMPYLLGFFLLIACVVMFLSLGSTAAELGGLDD
jgi:hypothetical protein